MVVVTVKAYTLNQSLHCVGNPTIKYFGRVITCLWYNGSTKGMASKKVQVRDFVPG